MFKRLIFICTLIALMSCGKPSNVNVSTIVKLILTNYIKSIPSMKLILKMQKKVLVGW